MNSVICVGCGKLKKRQSFMTLGRTSPRCLTCRLKMKMNEKRLQQKHRRQRNRELKLKKEESE